MYVKLIYFSYKSTVDEFTTCLYSLAEMNESSTNWRREIETVSLTNNGFLCTKYLRLRSYAVLKSRFSFYLTENVIIHRKKVLHFALHIDDLNTPRSIISIINECFLMECIIWSRVYHRLYLKPPLQSWRYF